MSNARTIENFHSMPKPLENDFVYACCTTLHLVYDMLGKSGIFTERKKNGGANRIITLWNCGFNAQIYELQATQTAFFIYSFPPFCSSTTYSIYDEGLPFIFLMRKKKKMKYNQESEWKNFTLNSIIHAHNGLAIFNMHKYFSKYSTAI